MRSFGTGAHGARFAGFALVLAALSPGACGGTTTGGGNNPDGRPGHGDGGGPDGHPGLFDGGMPDARLCTPFDGGTGATTVFLNFGGVTLHKGLKDDSRTDTSSLIPADVVVPPFLDGMAGRDAIISGAITRIGATWAPWAVTFTGTRPATGDYVQIVFGGNPMSILGSPAIFTGVGDWDCGNLNLDDLQIVFDTSGFSSTATANAATLFLSDALGLSPTTEMGNCVDHTRINSAPCTFDLSAPLDQGQKCPGAGARQNQPDYLSRTLGCQ